MANLKDIRNIVLLGHASSGKTSLAEAILHTTGTINRLGSIDEKNTVGDFDDEEKERGNSIHSALMYADYEGKHINIIDTPGYPGFISPALVSIAAAETAVVVISAAAGIEMNTRKLFQAATNAGKARIIVINKMDADNVDLTELVEQIRETFGSQCRCANLPTMDKSAIINCITTTEGDSAVRSVADAHTNILECIVEADDELMEKYLGGEEVSPEQVAGIFVKALDAGTVVPILFTDSRSEVGIKELLELIVKETPSPAQEMPPILKDGETETQIEPDPNGPLAGHVFRVGFDPRSNMKYASIRIFSGSLDSGTHLMVNDAKKPIRPGHPLQIQGTEVKEVDKGICGDIVTLAKLDELKLGDLVHDGKFAGKFKTQPLPKPMFALALEPASRGDEGKISAALDKLTAEDACFTVSHDTQTKELVINGMGDLHLRVMLSKLENRKNLITRK